MRPPSWLLIIAVLGHAAPGSAQTTLAWKFHAGDAFVVEQRIAQATALEIKNKPFRQKSELTLRTRWRVTDVAKDSAQLSVTVDAMTSKVSSGDGKASVPSKDDELWRGTVFLLTVDAQGRLQEVKGHEELLRKLAGNSPQRLKILTALKPPESFRALFQDVLGPLPAKPVTPGARWQHTSLDTMSIFGSFEQTTDFKYLGPRDGLHAVETLTKTTYKAPRYAVENDVFRILKGEVSADDGKGTFHFDAELGRMRRVQKSINLRGDLTLETLNGTQRVAFTSTTETEIRVGEKR